MISEERSLAPACGNANSIPQVDIICNGESMRVSQTLADTLQRLRYQEWRRPKHTRARKLWVYLFCINQEDLNEPGQQLSIIRDVYARASKVLVWLGEDTGEVQLDMWAELPVQRRDSMASIDTTGRFTYSDLEDGEFRLLTIISMRADEVICELAHFTIANAPDYDALSYAWGENIPTTICCNGYELVVQQNLFQFLKQLASNTDIASPRRHIWIDAICINQADDEEKGR
jgi:Heterokaryon incompatibility protein (HET)